MNETTTSIFPAPNVTGKAAAALTVVAALKNCLDTKNPTSPVCCTYNDDNKFCPLLKSGKFDMIAINVRERN